MIRGKTMGDDKRLDRLLDYTKFHIGIYLAMAGGLFAIAGSIAKDNGGVAFLKELVAQPWALMVAAVCMALAGMCGGVIASCCTQCKSFTALWDRPQGPHTLKLAKGSTWALVEHSSFWVGAAFLAFSLVGNCRFVEWVVRGS
jgi:hypothetical protein